MSEPHAVPRNHILAALPAADLDRLRPSLEPVELQIRQSLYRVDDVMPDVHFPESGWLSMLITLENGDSAEVGLVGREGMIGLPVFHGSDRTAFEVMVQAPGTALRLSAAAFHRALADSAALRRIVGRYGEAFGIQLAWTAACNGRHAIEQRLARWLLMAHDRADGEDFPMTHEFLSMMLGVRRAGITVAAGALQKAGLIRYERGHIAVVDRPGLEAAACECHDNVQREHRRLMGRQVPT